MPTMVCDRILQNPNNDNLDGIILGISHAEIGIIKENLDKRTSFGAGNVDFG